MTSEMIETLRFIGLNIGNQRPERYAFVYSAMQNKAVISEVFDNHISVYLIERKQKTKLANGLRHRPVMFGDVVDWLATKKLDIEENSFYSQAFHTMMMLWSDKKEELMLQPPQCIEYLDLLVKEYGERK